MSSVSYSNRVLSSGFNSVFVGVFAYLSHLGHFENSVDPDSRAQHVKLVFKKEGRAALES